MKLTYANYIWNGSFNANNLQSVNEVLGNYQIAVYQYNNPYVSGFVNLQPIRNIYIHSSQLSNYNQVNLPAIAQLLRKYQSQHHTRELSLIMS